MRAHDPMEGGAGGGREETCPVCGSAVVGHRFGAGSSVSWCSRCSWSRIVQPDGRVDRETAVAPSAVRPLADDLLAS